MLYLHGGSYLYGSPENYRDFLWRIANVTAAHVLCIDYRLAPEHPFPAALDDAVAAYRWLLADGADPRRTAIIGDSAGGGLTFGTLLRLRDEGLAMPGAAVGLSPWTDLALTGDIAPNQRQGRPDAQRRASTGLRRALSRRRRSEDIRTPRRSMATPGVCRHR